MKHLKIRDGNACDEANILASMFVDKEKEYSLSPEEYNSNVPDFVRARSPYFYTGNGRGFVLRQMMVMDVVHRIASKIPGVRLTTRKLHVAQESKVTEHVYVHLNDEPFYRAVIFFGYGEVSICSHHLNASDLPRRMRSSPVPGVHGGHSYNSLDRPLTLKNLLNDVLNIVKKVCAAAPVTVSDFEGTCFKGQGGRVATLEQGSNAVAAAITKMIGRSYSYGKEVMDDDLRVAAFLALESVVRGTKPVFSAGIAERFGKYIPQIDAAREDAAASNGKLPVQLIKIKGHDRFVAKIGSRIAYWHQLPDAVVAPVATVMSLGADGGSVAGVGSMVVPVATSPLELDMVVMVDAEEKL